MNQIPFRDQHRCAVATPRLSRLVKIPRRRFDSTKLTALLALVQCCLTLAAAAAALPEASVSSVSLAEGNTGNTAFDFTVTLSAASSEEVTVAYATSPGTATESSDYAAASGTLTFAPGDLSKTITVMVSGDTRYEADETFKMILSDPVGATLGTSEGIGTITNDDALPVLTIADVAVSEGDSGTVNAVFTVTLAPASGQDVTVNYAAADVTATVGSDYVANSGLLSFTAGQTTQTISVAVNGDTLNELNETFKVALSNPAGATLARMEATGTIENDDALPTLSIADVTVTEGNSGTVNAVFTVTLAPASGQDVTVNYAASDVTATVGSDYVANSGLLSFTAGQTIQTVTVVVNGDTLNELNETFKVALSNPAGATLARTEATGTIENDDPLPTLSIAGVTVTEGNSGTVNAVFTVTLAPASAQDVTVDYATTNVTAAVGIDYLAGSGALSFPPAKLLRLSRSR